MIIEDTEFEVLGFIIIISQLRYRHYLTAKSYFDKSGIIFLQFLFTD